MGLAEQRGNGNFHFQVYLSLNLTQEDGKDFVVVDQYHSISAGTHKQCEVKRTEGLFALVFFLFVY